MAFWDGYLAGWNLQRLRNADHGSEGKVLNLSGYVNGRSVQIGGSLIVYQCRLAPESDLSSAADAAIDGFLRDAAHPVSDEGTEAAQQSAASQLAVTVDGRDTFCSDLTDQDQDRRETAGQVVLGAIAGMQHARSPAAHSHKPTTPEFDDARLIDLAKSKCREGGDNLVSLGFVAEAAFNTAYRSEGTRP